MPRSAEVTAYQLLLFPSYSSGILSPSGNLLLEKAGRARGWLEREWRVAFLWVLWLAAALNPPLPNLTPNLLNF